MPNGPFSAYKFLGASLVAVECGLGWNEQESWAQATVVEDRDAGDHFTPPRAGEPARVEVGEWAFEGILQAPQRQVDQQGNPRFTVRLVDPRPILAGAVVLTDSYIGPTSGVPNLLNAYGYWESALGFGGSMANESGMLWESPYDVLGLGPSGVAGGFQLTQAGTVGIAPAIAAMTARATPFGGPLSFQGHEYAVDLGGLPTAQPYYRLGGTGRTVLDMVSELCQDAGHDYYAYLDGGTIRFRSVDRTRAPEIGTVAATVAAMDDATQKNYGTELRNDVTNVVLLGGNAQELVQVLGGGTPPAIWPYWGKDAGGVPIVGTGDPTGDHEFYLDCSEIAGVVGSTSYHCTAKELRCALVDYESWAAYVLMWDADKGAAIGLVSSIDSTGDLADLFPDVLFRRDLIEVDHETLAVYGGMNEQDYWTRRGQVVYDFVRRHADEHLGSRWLVRLPFPIYWRLEPETNQRLATHEVSDGGYVPEGGQPIGIAYDSINAFMTDDGRFGAFVAFPLDPTMDLTRVSPDSAALSNGSLYMRAQADPEVLYLPGDTNPYVVLTLDQPLYQMAKTPLGDVDEIAALLQLTPDQLADAIGVRHGSFPFRVHPNIFMPTAAAVPVRDNRNSYGPWGTFPPYAAMGPPGKVLFERDETLVPWNYGGPATLQQAALAKVAGAATAMLVGETATATRVGLPSVALGDALVEGGPNVTGINVGLSAAGVTTTYTMQTYTPQFGAFQRANADRLRRMGLAAQQQRRQLRALFRNRARAQGAAVAASLGWMENTSRAVAQATPHEMVLATMRYGAVDGRYRTMASTSTVEEFAANVRTDNDDIYSACGGMSLEGLYRPFSCTRRPAGSGLPHFETPDANLNSLVPTTDSIDPLRDSDVDLMVNAPTYGDGNTLHRLKGSIDYDNARGVGLKGPLVLVGYGHEWTGKPLPNAGDETLPVDLWSSSYADDYKRRPERWRAGVMLDVRWDNWRKGWAAPTALEGVLAADLATDGSTPANMFIQVDKVSIGDKLAVYCTLGGPTIAAGTRVSASYYGLEDKWKVVAAACGS